MGSAGLVYVDGRFKPFNNFREIRRGRNKGCIEVEVRKVVGSKNEGWKIVNRAVVVIMEEIKRFPAGDNINHPVREEVEPSD